jgi:hypothetical protein
VGIALHAEACEAKMLCPALRGWNDPPCRRFRRVRIRRTFLSVYYGKNKDTIIRHKIAWKYMC